MSYLYSNYSYLGKALEYEIEEESLFRITRLCEGGEGH